MYDASMSYNRDLLERKLGKKIRAEQWRILQSICEERGLVNPDGIIDKEVIDTLVTIKQYCGKFTSNKAVFNTYFDMLAEFKSREHIYGYDVWKELKKRCKERNGFTPEDSTIYGWFNRSGLKYKSSAKYEADKLIPVLIKCIFAKQPKRKKTVTVNTTATAISK